MEKTDKVFDFIFNPRSVAIIGASHTDFATLAQMKTKIRERLYLVNPKYTEVLGKKCYPSILDIEAEIDYVIIGISSSALPKVMEECIQKGVRAHRSIPPVSVRRGFPERIKQEEDLKRMAKEESSYRAQLFRAFTVPRRVCPSCRKLLPRKDTSASSPRVEALPNPSPIREYKKSPIQ